MSLELAVGSHAVAIDGYDIVGLSVMSPQATDAYIIFKLLKNLYPEIVTVIVKGISIKIKTGLFDIKQAL